MSKNVFYNRLGVDMEVGDKVRVLRPPGCLNDNITSTVITVSLETFWFTDDDNEDVSCNCQICNTGFEKKSRITGAILLHRAKAKKRVDKIDCLFDE
jgi:hypothetical protein